MRTAVAVVFVATWLVGCTDPATSTPSSSDDASPSTQAGAASTTATTGSQLPWVAPESPDQFASGLTIGFIPDGFVFVWNEGHESAVFHVFETADGTGHVAIGRQISSEPYQGGEDVVRGDRHFTVVHYPRETRVVEELGGDIRIEVVSRTLDDETLLRIAESVVHNPDLDG